MGVVYEAEDPRGGDPPDWSPGRRRPRRRPRRGHRPPRRQAREHLPHRPQRREGARFRRRPASTLGGRRRRFRGPHPREAHDPRHGRGHRRLHVARAGARPRGRRAVGRLLARGGAVRDGDGGEALPRRVDGRGVRRDPAQGSDVAGAAQSEDAARAGADRQPLPGEGPGEALGLGGGAARRARTLPRRGPAHGQREGSRAAPRPQPLGLGPGSARRRCPGCRRRRVHASPCRGPLGPRGGAAEDPHARRGRAGQLPGCVPPRRACRALPATRPGARGAAEPGLQELHVPDRPGRCHRVDEAVSRAGWSLAASGRDADPGRPPAVCRDAMEGGEGRFRALRASRRSGRDRLHDECDRPSGVLPEARARGIPADRHGPHRGHRRRAGIPGRSLRGNEPSVQGFRRGRRLPGRAVLEAGVQEGRARPVSGGGDCGVRRPHRTARTGHVGGGGLS